MAFTAITAGEITEGEATKAQIFTKLRDNFQSHEDRLFTLEEGIVKPSSNTGVSNTQSITYVAIASLSITLTSTARGVLLLLDTIEQVQRKSLGIEGVNSINNARGLIRLQRGTTDLCYFDYRIQNSGNSVWLTSIPASALKFVDHPGAGSFTYNWAYRVTDATNFRISIDDTNAIAVPL